MDVGFTEMDYIGRESTGLATVTILKTGMHSGSLVAKVTSLTYQQLKDRGLTLGTELALTTLPDPAEGMLAILLASAVINSFPPNDTIWCHHGHGHDFFLV